MEVTEQKREEKLFLLTSHFSCKLNVTTIVTSNQHLLITWFFFLPMDSFRTVVTANN